MEIKPFNFDATKSIEILYEIKRHFEGEIDRFENEYVGKKSFTNKEIGYKLDDVYDGYLKTLNALGLEYPLLKFDKNQLLDEFRKIKENHYHRIIKVNDFES